MKEIGSEFWDVPICDEKNNIFPESTNWFLSGRSALRAIIKEIKQRQKVYTVALPSWCCESIIVPFIEAGLQISFYPVIFINSFQQDVRSVMDCDILFVMDYFGYINAPEIVDYSGIIIRDVTHSLFSKNYNDNSYCFGSLRKWCGIWTGGFLYGKELNLYSVLIDYGYINLRQKAMNEKASYISGKRKEKTYLSLFEDAERYLTQCTDIYSSIERDIDMSIHIDVGYIKRKRRMNAEILLNNLPKETRPIFLEIEDDDCPMFVPVFVNKRNKLRQFLVDNQIYCPIHWPISKYHKLNYEMKEIYDKELSIICDQRYDTDDMIRICKLIREGINLC